MVTNGVVETPDATDISRGHPDAEVPVSEATDNGEEADSTLGKTGDVSLVLLRHVAVVGHLLVGLSEEPIAVVVIKPLSGFDRSRCSR